MKDGYVPIPFWVPVKGFESRYRICDRGVIMRIDYPIPTKGGSSRRMKPKPLKPMFFPAGYPFVILYLTPGCRQVTKTIHRLIALSFLSNPKNLPEVNHKNGIKSESHLYNLEWVTQSENSVHSYQCLGRKPSPSRGERNYFSKLNFDQVTEIKKLKESEFAGWSLTTASKIVCKRYGVRPSAIWNIWTVRTWAGDENLLKSTANKNT